MKVAHVLRKYDCAEWGGTETAVLGLCAGLKSQGTASVVFAPRVPRRSSPDPLVAAGIAVRRYSALVPIWGLTPEQRQRLRAVGGNLLSFDLFWRLWGEPQLDAIHSHALGRIGSIAGLVARLRRIPFVLTLHGPVYNLPPSLAERYQPKNRGFDWGKICGALLRSRDLLDRGDAIFTGNAEAASLVRRHHPLRRVIVHPHSIDLRAYQHDHRLEAESAYPRIRGRDLILAVGRIDPAKNQAWLVEHWPETAKRLPNAHLMLVGAATDVTYLHAVQRRIDILGLRDHITIAGGLPSGDPRLTGLMQAARAMVLPSLAESFGLVILDAWAAETPIIAARNPGAESLIEHGRNGLLFQLHERQEYLDCVVGAVKDPSFTARLIAGGRQSVSEFDRGRLAARMLKVYRDLAEERLPRADLAEGVPDKCPPG
ncbi:MAG TPA: glycosyltransferase family 4 protein [Opitutaceae bacterium]|jgi:glycosyltransferase involved in cell wall biosynthesis